MLEIDKYFFKYKNICRKIINKEIELEELQEKTIGSVNYNEKTSNSHTPKGLEQREIYIENLQDNIKKLYAQKENKKAEHIADFEKLSKDEYKNILISYYLDFVNIKKISIKLDKSIGHIKKLKREAIKELLTIIN